MSLSSSAPKISVILPFYNARHTLRQALNSIQKQTYDNFECILVDNNSGDDSPQIAYEFKQKDKRFKCFHEQRQGVTFAANCAEKQIIVHGYGLYWPR